MSSEQDEFLLSVGCIFYLKMDPWTFTLVCGLESSATVLDFWREAHSNFHHCELHQVGIYALSMSSSPFLSTSFFPDSTDGGGKGLNRQLQ